MSKGSAARKTVRIVSGSYSVPERTTSDAFSPADWVTVRGREWKSYVLPRIYVSSGNVCSAELYYNINRLLGGLADEENSDIFVLNREGQVSSTASKKQPRP